MNRILIVGEAPGRRDGGRTRARISELAGRPYEEWADWINLLDGYPGPAPGGKGTIWDKRAADAAAVTLIAGDAFDGYDAVILLGRRVAQTLIRGGAGFPFFRFTDDRPPMAVIPHTSGIVRFWNDDANVEQARDFLRQTIRSVRGEVNHMTEEQTEPVEAEASAPELDLQQELLARVRETEALADVAEVEKKGYVRLSRETATIGYVHKATRSGVRVEIPADGGGYDLIKVTKRGELRKALTAIEKRAAKTKEAATA